jgi:CheY-like chemotaxis protein
MTKDSKSDEGKTKRSNQPSLTQFSHDLRNPLAAIQNAVEVIRIDAGISKDSSLMLEVIDRQVKQLLGTLSDLSNKDAFDSPQQTDSVVFDTPTDVNLAAPRIREILVVDDTRSVRNTFQLMLEKLGHSVRTASDGKTALIAIQHKIPDIVFSDVCMDGMDGYELARKIRSTPKYKGISLIALTGSVTRESKSASIAAGFDDLIEKPIKYASLVEALNLMELPRFPGSLKG